MKRLIGELNQTLSQEEITNFTCIKISAETLPQICLGGPGLRSQICSSVYRWGRDTGSQLGGIPAALRSSELSYILLFCVVMFHSSHCFTQKLTESQNYFYLMFTFSMGHSRVLCMSYVLNKHLQSERNNTFKKLKITLAFCFQGYRSL